MSLFSNSSAVIPLPPVRTKGSLSLEEALARRRSIRSYRALSLSLEELSQLLWSAQGITSRDGFRTAPSAGALFPIELYVAVSNINNLEMGFYHYNPQKHTLTIHQSGEFAIPLAHAALGQDAVTDAAANIIISGNFKRVASKYRERGIQYTWMEAGHVSQNIYLQCESLGLCTVCIGAFHDERVQKTLSIGESPLYIMPVGKK